MIRVSFLLVLSGLVMSACSVFCPKEEWSTVPRTNNPHTIIDANQGSALGSPEY